MILIINKVPDLKKSGQSLVQFNRNTSFTESQHKFVQAKLYIPRDRNPHVILLLKSFALILVSS